jgi:hypothetical protein
VVPSGEEIAAEFVEIAAATSAQSRGEIVLADFGTEARVPAPDGIPVTASSQKRVSLTDSRRGLGRVRP